MSRTPTQKQLELTRLASGHGGWIYCGGCGETIGYLCYVTYDSFRLSYQCNCGSRGSMHLAFAPDAAAQQSSQPLITVKNRLCCPQDRAPLFTVLTKKLAGYRYEVICTTCGARYAEERGLEGPRSAGKDSSLCSE